MSIPGKMNLVGMLARLRAGEEGHAQIYLDLEGINLYRSGDQFYLYNTYSGLWIKSQPFMVCASISVTLARVINLVMDELLRTGQSKTAEIRELKNWLTQTPHLAYCQRVLSYIPSSSPPLQFDRHPDRLATLPLKGSQNLDLLTGVVRQRKRDDLFTFDCPILYQPRPNLYPLDLMISLMVGADRLRVVQSLLGLCLTGWKSPLTMIIVCGPGRFQLLDPLVYLLDRFHWRARKGQLVQSIRPPIKPLELNSASESESVDASSLDVTKLEAVRCLTTLDPADQLDSILVQALHNQSIKLIVANSVAPRETEVSIPGSTVIHVSSVKGSIDPLIFLPWLVDGVRLWYEHLHPDPDSESDSEIQIKTVTIDPYSPKSLLK